MSGSAFIRAAKTAAVPWLKRLGWRPRAMRVPRVLPHERLTAADVPTRVMMGPGRTLLVNDRPFFPNGLYYAREEIADRTGAGLARLKAAGFNLVFFDGDLDAAAELDRIWNAGLYVWFRPPGQLFGNFSHLKEIVSTFARHPAVLLWEMDDEPILNDLNWRDAAIGSRLVRELDPFHPVLCNQWYTGNESDVLLRHWADVADVHSFGMYPVPAHRWGRKMTLVNNGWPHSIAVVGTHVDKWRSIAPNAPVIAVLQAFAPNALEDGAAGFPTHAQARFMAYHAVIHGANGLSHFGVTNPSTPHVSCGIPPAVTSDLDQTHAHFLRTCEMNRTFWRSYSPLVLEIARMAGVFTSPDADWTPASGSGIECVVKQHDGRAVLIAVNATPLERSIELRAPALVNLTLQVWGESRSIRTDAHGILRDTLDAFGVRVYSTGPDRLN